VSITVVVTALLLHLRHCLIINIIIISSSSSCMYIYLCVHVKDAELNSLLLRYISASTMYGIHCLISWLHLSIVGCVNI